MQQMFGTPTASDIAIDYSGAFVAAALRTGLIAKLIAMHPALDQWSRNRLRTARKARIFHLTSVLANTLNHHSPADEP